MAESGWADYVRRVSGDATPAEIGREVGTHRSVVGNWLKGGGVEAAVAVRFARHYGANVLEALAAAGYIAPDEVALTEVDRGVHQAETVEMLRELLRRAEGAVGDDQDHSESTLPHVSHDRRQDDYDVVAKSTVVEVNPDDSAV